MWQIGNSTRRNYHKRYLKTKRILEEILHSTLNQSQLCKGSKKAIQSLKLSRKFSHCSHQTHSANRDTYTPTHTYRVTVWVYSLQYIHIYSTYKYRCSLCVDRKMDIFFTVSLKLERWLNVKVSKYLLLCISKLRELRH